jgi:hypothetical protein
VKLQKNTHLALCSVLEFAAHPGEQLSAAEIAAKYRMSPHHLAKVLRALGRAGLVRAARGAGGGYRFAGNEGRATARRPAGAARGGRRRLRGRGGGRGGAFRDRRDRQGDFSLDHA